MKQLVSEDVADRLRAWANGRPIPRFQTKCFEIAKDPYVVALVRMGGEGRPWAIASGPAGGSPTVRSVADPRVQQAVAPMVESFGQDLLRVFPAGKSSKVDQNDPQLWLPDPSHLDLLHQMAFAYAYERWPLPDMRQLNRAGKLFNSLFLQSTHPAQNTVMTATEVLRSLYTFPATPARQGHLGFLIAWLVEHGDRTMRQLSASSAEERAVSTSIDGEFERRVLYPLLERYVASGREDSETAGQIMEFVEEEARRRWDITVASLRIIRRDHRPTNSGVVTVKERGRRSWNQLWCEPAAREDAGESPRWRGRETDRGAVAAARYYLRNELAERLRVEALAHGDSEIARLVVRQGRGLVGKIITIDTQDGSVRMQYSEPEHVDIREGTSYQCFGDRALTLQAEDSDPSSRQVDLRVTSGSISFRARQQVLLLEHAPEFLTENKINNMDSGNTELDRQLRSAAQDIDEVPDNQGDDE